MYKTNIWYLNAGILTLSLAVTACNDDKSSTGKVIEASPSNLDYSLSIKQPVVGSSASAVAALTLPSLSAQADAQLGMVTFTVGEGENRTSASANFNVGFGSGAYHRAGEPNNQFYTITDRGPNIKCGEVGEVLATLNNDPSLETTFSDFCGEGHDKDKVFPKPSFTPTIYQWQIEQNEDGLTTRILTRIPLKNNKGELISGLTNDFTVTNTEQAFDTMGKPLAFDNQGLDTEALIRLQDGSFWLSDEYAPSLIHVASDGTIIQRVVPVGVAADLADADYPIAGLLPDILKSRKLNRGIESLAISPDEQFLYFIMQSPLANPDTSTYKNSRTVRIMKYALTNGELGDTIGEYLYELDRPQSFATSSGLGDVGKSQSSVKISEMLALANDDLIILERINATTKLYRIALSTGDNILNQPIHNGLVDNNESSEQKTLEQVYSLAAHNAKPVIKHLAFNSLTDLPQGVSLANKIEGIALLDDDYLALINDNDFGINGDDTQVTLLKLSQTLNKPSLTPKRLTSSLIARYESGIFDESAAEIVGFHSASQQIFVVNANSGQIDVIDASPISEASPAAQPITLNNLSLTTRLELNSRLPDVELGAANSLSIHNDLLAVAIEAKNKQAEGYVAFYQIGESIDFIKAVKVGALPDMVSFTPNGKKVLIANEGEPSGDYLNDPEGSIAIIEIIDNMPADTATLIDFQAFNAGGSRADELPSNVRIFGGAFGQPKSSVAQDLEPEYLSISDDSATAYVSLQENNALAIIDINSASISSIKALGVKDYSQAGNSTDLSDRDLDEEGVFALTGTQLNNGKARINLIPQSNVVGMYQPDSIAVYQYNQKNYIVTANEGDAREYIAANLTSESACNDAGYLWNDGDCFSYLEEFRVEDLQDLNDANFTGLLPLELAAKENKFAASFNTDKAMLGRLKTTINNGFNTKSDQFDTLYSYGARSFTIWNEQGQQVFDSGNDMERVTAGQHGAYFNASNDKAGDSKKNDRSSAKGPEPEALAIGKVGERTYAFIGLERDSGIMIYDITSPYGVQLVDYLHNRDFSKDPSKEAAGDAGPEGMKFVPAEQSPNGQALLIVGNEVSGSTSVYQLK